MIIDIAGELVSRRGQRFEDYTDAVRKLAVYEEFSDKLLSQLDPVPGFRNVVIHEYLKVDLEHVIRALDNLDAIEEFLRIVVRMESEG